MKKVGLIVGIIAVIVIAAVLGYIAFRQQTSQPESSGGQQPQPQPQISWMLCSYYYREGETTYTLSFPYTFSGKESGGFQIVKKEPYGGYTYQTQIIASGTFERKGNEVYFHRTDTSTDKRYQVDFEMLIEWSDGKWKLVYQSASRTEIWVED